MIKIAHAADIHIRSARYLDEIKFTFERFYEELRAESPDLILLCGDIFHSKLTVSNEYFEIASTFFRRLTDISTLMIIPGNHDLNLNDKARMDAITPVITAIEGTTKNPIIYSKFSESIPFSENLEFHHFSILDKKSKWRRGETLNQDKINIALYHGCINGIIFDNGWVSRGNKDDIDIFDYYDFGMLGDIHIQQYLKNKRVAYPGSIRQGNYGETVDKGFLIWEIEDRDSFDVRRVLLEQKRYFITLYGKCVEDVQEVGDLPPDCRIRFQLTEDIEIVEELKIKSEIEKLYSPCNDVRIVAARSSLDIGTIKVGGIDVLHENIRDPEVQKELIKEYFKGKNLSEEDLQLVRNLDKVYHSSVETDVERNVIYHIQDFSWDNLFSYGENNSVNVKNAKGLIGIFGENAGGKSSIMDILSLGLTNQVHKEGATKNIDFINKRSNLAVFSSRISMSGKDYEIKRGLTRKTGKNGESCQTTVEFHQKTNNKDISMNGERKPDTNKNIRNKFGTYDQLQFTNLCPQFSLTSFIDSKGTKRKEALTTYFDLDVFNTKYKLAKQDLDKVKAKLEGYEYSRIQSDIDSGKLELESIRVILKEYNKEKLERVNFLEEDSEKLKILYLNLKNIEYDYSDMVLATRKLEENKEKIKKAIETIEIHRMNCSDFSYMKISLKEFQEEFKLSQSEIREGRSKLKTLQAEKRFLVQSSDLLKKIPNVPQCKVCPLAHSAFEADEEIPRHLKKSDEISMKISELEISSENRDYSIIPEWQKSEKSRELLRLSLESLRELRSQAKNLELDVERISSNLEEILTNQKEADKIIKKEDEIKSLRGALGDLEDEILELNSRRSVLDYKQKEQERQICLCEELNQEKYILDLYLDAMGKDGISYWIISKKMPIINKQVNFILSQAVNFKLFIEDSSEEKSVKIFVVDEKGKRPIELGSGMEKTVSSIALRAALWNVCLLPKTPVLMLDEVFAHLDSEKYESVIKLLVYLKTYFKSIFVITHNENLKPVMDHSYYIKKNSKGFASCKIG